ncbi:hypothetical protein CF319_g6551 [Tilletia indica]|nr:hypothetical protein CF319_g6551 [Tilletia indica]
MTTPAPSASGSGANVGASFSIAAANTTTTAKSSAAANTISAEDGGGGEDLPGGPIWAELGSKMLQHSGGRPPNSKVNYRRKWQKSLARWEDVTQEQVECKKSLASAVAKQIKLQDEVNYLIDMIGAVQSGSIPEHASSTLLLAPRSSVQQQFSEPSRHGEHEYIDR